ncbi:MAG TPA: hypothetical protein VGB20_06500 [bacterium]
MIEGPAASASGGAPERGRPMTGSWRPRGGPWAGRLWQRLVFGSGRAEREDLVLRNLRLATRVGWLVLVALGCYVMLDLFVFQQVPRFSADGRLEPSGDAVAAVPASEAPIDQLARPLSEYIAAAVQRNPFTGTSEATASAPAPARSARDELLELSKTLVVVGIAQGITPEALVEDTKQQRTFFLRVGDAINGLTVREISSKGVLVTYEGEELLLN